MPPKAVEAGKNAVSEEEMAMTHKEQGLAMQRNEERAVERHSPSRAGTACASWCSARTW